MDSKDYLVELRESTGMTRKEFGNRKMPDYLLRLMEYKIRMEQGIKDGKELENNK